MRRSRCRSSSSAICAPDEVLVRVAAAGICHTDLIMRDQWYPVPLPAVLGHEGAGVVERVGSAVTLVAPGDRVGMSFDSCGHCPTCRTGRPAYCHDFWALQLRLDAPGRHERALARRRAHPRALLRAVVLRHARRRERAQRRQAAGLDPARDRGALRLRRSRPGPAACSTRSPRRPGAPWPSSAPARSGCRRSWPARSPAARRSSAIDRNPARLELARELGATHVVNAARARRRRGDPRASPATAPTSAWRRPAWRQLLRQAVDCLAPRGMCGSIGAAAIGTEVASTWRRC